MLALIRALTWILCIRKHGSVSWTELLTSGATQNQFSALLPFLVMPVGELEDLHRNFSVVSVELRTAAIKDQDYQVGLALAIFV